MIRQLQPQSNQCYTARAARVAQAASLRSSNRSCREKTELDGKFEEVIINLTNALPLTLALDTTQPTLCLALMRGAEIIASVVDSSLALHSQRLFPLLNDMLADQSLAPAALDLLAVNTGPGSFTGLRVGLAAAKGLAATLGKPAVGINALDALALATGETNVPIVTLLNASRGELFGGLRWVEANGRMRVMGDDWVGGIEEVQARCSAQLAAADVIFTGQGAASNWATLQLISTRWRLLAAPNSLAPTIGRAAWKRWQMGASSTVTAYYIRPSEAEIKYSK